MTSARTFPCRAESVTAARHFLREALGEQHRGVVEQAELMTSELATNCVLHAHSEFEVTVATGKEIRVEVRDEGSGEPERLSPAPTEPSGRGLLIVETLAEKWGVRHTRAGKTVWFTLPIEPAGSPNVTRRRWGSLSRS